MANGLVIQRDGWKIQIVVWRRFGPKEVIFPINVAGNVDMGQTNCGVNNTQKWFFQRGNKS